MADQGVDASSRQGLSFYGWRIVGVVFIMLMVSSGLGFYNLSVFINALSNEGTFSVDTASNATSLFFLVGAASGLAIGKLIDRYDPRYTICIGAFLAAAGLVAIGRASTPTALFVSYVLFAIGFSCTSLIPGTTMVARWFSKRRALALSIASTGLSVGGIVITPLAAAMVSKMGLHDATPIFAIGYIVAVVPLTVLMLRRSPENMGLEPDGVRTLSSQRKSSLPGTTFSSAIRTRFFILCTGAYILVFLAQVGGLAHQFNLVAERIDTTIAATAVASLAGASMIGRFIGGWAISRYSLRMVTVILIVLEAFSLALLAYSGTIFSLLGATVLLGLALGNLLMALPLLLADAFGMREYGRIYATSQAIAQLGVAMGPALVGYLHSVWVGYSIPYVVIAGLALMGSILFFLAGPTPSPAHND